MPKPYRIEVLPSAVRQFEALPRQARGPVRDAIDALVLDPRPAGSELLVGAPRERIHRLRVGDYRILYQVFDDRLVVLVVRVADRREAYNERFLQRLRKQIRGASMP